MRFNSSSQSVFFIGCGAIGFCTLELLIKYFGVPPSRLIVFDAQDRRDRLKGYFGAGLQFYHLKITKENVSSLFLKYLRPGDILIDVATCIDTCTLLALCFQFKVHYLNTCIECWEGAENSLQIPLFSRYEKIKALQKSFGVGNYETALLDHGMNPGLITHLVKKGLGDFCRSILEKEMGTQYGDRLEKAITAQDFAQMAFLANIETIHIAEKDSQEVVGEKPAGIFAGTWSIDGLLDEMKTASEIGWGSHERQEPPGTPFFSINHKQILLHKSGGETKIRSWVPSGEIVGRAFRHGEVSTLSRLFSLGSEGQIIYQPSIYYAYQPCSYTLQSMEESISTVGEKISILTDEIISGTDEVGSLLLSSRFGTWWTGSILDIDKTRDLIPHQNATILQVSIGVVAGCLWILENPHKGVCFPEDLPYEKILSLAAPFLGQIVSMPANWDYLKKLENYQFYNFAASKNDESASSLSSIEYV